jgi:hypothetical protein
MERVAIHLHDPVGCTNGGEICLIGVSRNLFASRRCRDGTGECMHRREVNLIAHFR